MFRACFVQVRRLLHSPSPPPRYQSCFFVTATEQVDELQTQIDQMNLERPVQNFVDLGFTKKDGFSIVSQHPSLAEYSFKKLKYQFDVLQCLGFKNTEIKAIISRGPKVLTASGAVLRKNLISLQKEIGERSARQAICLAPYILLNNSSVIWEKIDYCTIEMGLDNETIAKSKILQCDLRRIRSRHCFAYRSGNWRKIGKKNPEGLAPNMSIADLLFTTDEQFVNKIKGLTIEDYVVFEAMIENEYQNQLEEEEDMDNLSDEDDDPPSK